MVSEDWNTQAEYLLNVRNKNPWYNEDYLNFLFTNVWKLTQKPCRVLEVGCGTGNVPLWLLPFLAQGSEYTGIDTGEALLAEAEKTFKKSPYKVKFQQGSAYSLDFPDDSFDLVLTRAVLMHLEKPQQALKEMVRVTRSGGTVLSCEACRNGFAALFYIDEVDEIANSPLTTFQRENQVIKERTGIDYNIGMKLPVLFHQNGLQKIDCRFNDRISFILPPDLTPQMTRLYESLCKEGFGRLDEKQTAEWKQRLMQNGVAGEEADGVIAHFKQVDFEGNGKKYHTVYPHLYILCRGTKP
jgi:SAM-dependent methyltransferase